MRGKNLLVRWMPGFSNTFIWCLILIPLLAVGIDGFYKNFELSIWPALILMSFVALQSRLNKQSKDLIPKLMLRSAFGFVFEAVFMAPVIIEIIKIVATPKSQLYFFLKAFIEAAILEEGIKYYVLKYYSWDRPEFNHKYAAVIFAVAVGLGFAIMENFGYAFNFGYNMTLKRAYTATPAYCVLGIAMGWFYGEAKKSELKGKDRDCKWYKILALMVPMILHGTYDYLLFMDYMTFFNPLIVVMCILGLYKANELGRKDVMFSDSCTMQLF